MAKRKDLLLTEATTMRMMGLAGIGSLANPFLKETKGKDSFGDSEHLYHGQSRQVSDTQEEQEMEEGEQQKCPSCGKKKCVCDDEEDEEEDKKR